MLSADRRTLLQLAGGALAISFAAIFFRLALPTDPLLASALRLGLAWSILFAMRRWITRAAPPKAPDAALIRAGRIGGLLYAIHFGSWVASLSLTSVAASVTLVTATPLLLAMASLVAGRDRPTARQWIAVAVAIGGACIIGGSDLLTGQLVGDGLALVGAAAMAGYLFLARSLGPELDAVALSMRAAGWGAVFLGLAVLLALPFHAPVLPDAAALGWIALAAILPQVIGHTLLTKALERASPTEVGLATAAEPVLSTLLAWLWLAETPAAWVLAGCAMTLCGVVVGVARPRDDPQEMGA